MFSDPVNIGQVVISPSGPITATARETVTLQCSVDITPQNTPYPEIEWLFGPTSVLLSSTTTRNSGNTYTSTLQMAMVEESDEGMYTCRLRGNQRTAVSTMITVNPGELACLPTLIRCMVPTHKGILLWADMRIYPFCVCLNDVPTTQPMITVAFLFQLHPSLYWSPVV